MALKLILPNAPVIVERDAILIFLAGPARGGGDWQLHAMEIIAHYAPDAYVACPCRYAPNHPIRQLAVPGSPPTMLASAKIGQFPRQTIWERYYLKLASERGCILFWLPEEDKKNPRDPKDGPYARDTYGELGEWRGQSMHNGQVRMVVGAEEGFPGLSVITANFRAVWPHSSFPHETLKETVIEALGKARNKPEPSIRPK